MKHLLYRCLECEHEFTSYSKDGLGCLKCGGPVMPVKELKCIDHQRVKSIDRQAIAADVIDVLAKHKVPVILVDNVLAAVKAGVQSQAVQPATFKPGDIKIKLNIDTEKLREGLLDLNKAIRRMFENLNSDQGGAPKS